MASFYVEVLILLMWFFRVGGVTKKSDAIEFPIVSIGSVLVYASFAAVYRSLSLQSKRLLIVWISIFIEAQQRQTTRHCPPWPSISVPSSLVQLASHPAYRMHHQLSPLQPL